MSRVNGEAKDDDKKKKGGKQNSSPLSLIGAPRMGANSASVRVADISIYISQQNFRSCTEGLFSR